ncbi:hypothetical protein F5Y14DRAFT_308280 [Nemania sp. NC0429]|nr:hypothetical protein F5Y14DRAFT_308280 [Nemania sp. NC0429]
MASNAADGSLESLKALVESTTSLISQLERNLNTFAFAKANPDLVDRIPAHDAAATDSSEAAGLGSVDVVSLAHDSASLIKAHVTKLSLLIINEPFTPSVIVKVLRELVAGPVPAIASAAQLCTANTYTAVARVEFGWECRRVLMELNGFVQMIPLDGKILPDHRKNGTKGGKGSLTHTGILWAACDDVIRLKARGIEGLLVRKIEEHRDNLQDIMDELKQWGEEVGTHSEERNEAEQQLIDDIAEGVVEMLPLPIPVDDPDRIRERLDSCIKRLRLTILFFSAIIKRRIKTLPPLPLERGSPVIRRLNEVYPVLQSLVNNFEEISYPFYGQDGVEVDRCLDVCFFDAFAAAEMLKAPWVGTQDAFTEWASKFQSSIKKPE